MLANLREQPAAIIFFDRLIVEYHQSHIWLHKYLVTHVPVGAVPNQLPRPLDDSAYEVRQRFVVREEQQSWRQAYFFQISVSLQLIACWPPNSSGWKHASAIAPAETPLNPHNFDFWGDIC